MAEMAEICGCDGVMARIIFVFGAGGAFPPPVEVEGL